MEVAEFDTTRSSHERGKHRWRVGFEPIEQACNYVLRGKQMAAGLGFEPRLTGPEPVVLPLHHPASINRLRMIGSRDCIVNPTGATPCIFGEVRGWWWAVWICRACFAPAHQTETVWQEPGREGVDGKDTKTRRSGRRGILGGCGDPCNCLDPLKTVYLFRISQRVGD